MLFDQDNDLKTGLFQKYSTNKNYICDNIGNKILYDKYNFTSLIHM
jgi:hypothetical protein